MKEIHNKTCKDCGITYPETRNFFGQYKNKRKGDKVTIGFRNSCRKCMAKNTARYDKENPRKAKERNKRRQYWSEKAKGKYTNKDISYIRSQLQDRCRFCGSSLSGGGEIEHLTPVSRGGTHNKSNLSLACHKCNKEKTNKTMDEYFEWRRERNLLIHRVKPCYEKPDQACIAAGRKSYIQKVNLVSNKEYL